MPFTLAHPAAAIPLMRPLRGRAVLSALAIGSMVPDLPHWIPGLPRLATHSLPSLLWFSLPVGLTLFAIFHSGLKRAWVALLPPDWAERLAPETVNGRLRDFRAFDVAVSTVLGAATHVAIDPFTHVGGSVGRLVPPLGPPVSGPQFLFYAFSLGGLTSLVVVLLRWRLRTPVRRTAVSESRLGLRLAIVLSAAAWAALKSNFATPPYPGPWLEMLFVCAQFSIAFLQALVVLLLAWALFHALRPAESAPMA